MSDVNIIVTELDENNDFAHKRYIKYPLDRNVGFDYRSRVSHNAFFNGHKDRNHNNKHGMLYVEKHEDAFNKAKAFEIKFFKEYNIEYPHMNVPMVVVNSIFDFYKLIGYDHKKNKYAAVL